MYPRSGFRSGGTFECTLVPVFVPWEHPPKPPFWKPPFWQPPKMVPFSRGHEGRGGEEQVPEREVSEFFLEFF